MKVNLSPSPSSIELTTKNWKRLCLRKLELEPGELNKPRNISRRPKKCSLKLNID